MKNSIDTFSVVCFCQLSIPTLDERQQGKIVCKKENDSHFKLIQDKKKSIKDGPLCSKGR